MKTISRLFALFLCITLLSSVGLALAEAPTSIDEFVFPENLSDFDFSIFDPDQLASGYAEAHSDDLLIVYNDLTSLSYYFSSKTEKALSVIDSNYSGETLSSCSYEHNGRNLFYTAESDWLDENYQKTEAPLEYGTNATPASPEEYLLPESIEAIDLSIFSPDEIASGSVKYKYENDQYSITVYYDHEVTIEVLSISDNAFDASRRVSYVNGKLVD